MIERESTPMLLGPVLGAPTGVLISQSAGSREGQLQGVLIAGSILPQYLTLLEVALEAGRSIPRAIAASLVSAPVVMLVLAVWGVALTVIIFGLGVGPPAAVVFAGISFLPPLSFLQTWPAEVLGAITMVFVILWWMLLERVVDLFDRRPARPSGQADDVGRRRVGRTFVNVFRAGQDFMTGVVNRLRMADGVVGRWIVVPRAALPFVVAFIAAATAFVSCPME